MEIGRLGKISFPAGFYVYVGSAHGPGGLRARLARHARRLKPCHWHLDYLMPSVEILEARVEVGAAAVECRWSAELVHSLGGKIAAPGFGSSDCRCPAHLVYFDRRPRLAHLGTVIPLDVLTGSAAR